MERGQGGLGSKAHTIILNSMKFVFSTVLNAKKLLKNKIFTFSLFPQSLYLDPHLTKTILPGHFRNSKSEARAYSM